jgi:CheY-like chemotaxis protein
MVFEEMVMSQKQATAAETLVRDAEENAPRSLRVFVVENHTDTREFLTFMLEELGHTVIVADTMGKALRDAPAAKPDVIISDIGLPDGDGWELLHKLALPRPAYAIAMSGFGMVSDRARSKAAGFRHHLVKPMGLEQLESILREAAQELVPTAATEEK